MSSTFGAFADPTRRSLLGRLMGGPLSVCDLAAPFKISQQAISKHLAYLERAGLIRKTREGRQHFCALEATRFREAADWVGGYRQFWEQSFDRLDEYLREIQSKGGKATRRDWVSDPGPIGPGHLGRTNRTMEKT